MQLDDACCRITDSAGIGGNLLLLSVWSWERLPVGRPKSVRFNPWYEDEHDELRRPTWAYKWDVVSEMTNDVNLMYQKYVAKLDTITVGERSNFKNFLRTRKIMVMHSNEWGECSPRTLVDRKRKR